MVLRVVAVDARVLWRVCRSWSRLISSAAYFTMMIKQMQEAKAKYASYTPKSTVLYNAAWGYCTVTAAAAAQLYCL